jgi:DNA-binding MarR family transcriptional regulator
LHIQLSVSEEAKRIERECLGFRVRLSSRVIAAIYGDALSDAGLKVSQLTILVAVANREDTRPAEPAKFLQMDESTLSLSVERMCAKVCLWLEPNSDGRSHRITVTEKV